MNRLVLQRMLRDGPWTLEFAEDGPAAIAACAADVPDLVLMDLFMPGMSGIDATRAIRAAETAPDGRRAAMFAVTACTERATLDEALEAGIDEVIAKPVRKDAIRAIAEAHAGGVSQASPAD